MFLLRFIIILYCRIVFFFILTLYVERKYYILIINYINKESYIMQRIIFSNKDFETVTLQI